MSRFGDAFRGVKKAGGWIWDNTLGRDDNPQFGPGGPGIGPLDPTVMDPRMGPGMGPGMMDPEMGAYPGTVQRPLRQAFPRTIVDPDEDMGPGGRGLGPPADPRDARSPWDNKRGGGFGDYLTGDTAQVIAGGLGGLGTYMGSRMDRQSEEERIALEREKYKAELAFQKQKHADERADRAGMHGRGSSGPIKWRQY